MKNINSREGISYSVKQFAVKSVPGDVVHALLYLTLVSWVLDRTVLVNTQLCCKAKLSIYRSICISVVTHGELGAVARECSQHEFPQGVSR